MQKHPVFHSAGVFFSASILLLLTLNQTSPFLCVLYCSLYGCSVLYLLFYAVSFCDIRSSLLIRKFLDFSRDRSIYLI